MFNDSVMQARLPKKIYKELKKTIEEGKELSMEIADVVAHEMKEWAIEKGATHYSHWFQPLTGVTAEKHDAFITAPMDNGKVLMCFLRKRTDQRGTGCIFLPVRRIKSDFRGERIHSMGLHITGICTS